MTELTDFKLKDITYQNELLKIIALSPMEKTFITKPLILIQNNMKK